METLSVQEIVRGIADDSMKAERFALLQLLSNTVGDLSEPLRPDESTSVFTIALAKLVPETDSALIEVMLGLLTNATITEENARSFVNFLDKSEKYKSQFTGALNTFLDYNPQLETEEVDDTWSHMGSVLCNIAQIEEGRALVLRRSLDYMPRIIAQIRSRSAIRRRGAVGTIRSCLFDQDIHWWMVADLKVVDELVLPLVVATPFTETEKQGMNPIIWLQAELPDRQPEPDLDITKMLLECIVLLCQRRGIREELRKRKVYPVVRNLDIKTEDEAINTIIYEIVNFLMGDEDNATPIDTYDQSVTSTASGSAQRQLTNAETSKENGGEDKQWS